MKNVKTFEGFRKDGYKPVNESIQFGSFYFSDRTSFGEHSDDLPEKGESKFLVMSHTEVDLNGKRYRLEGDSSFGQSSKRYIIGIFDDEASATEAYKNAIKKPVGAFVSFSMGTLTAKSKFAFDYNEKDGHLAKIKVR